MIDPTTALTTAIENSTKVANTPLFSTVIDKLLGFKISEWNAQGGVIKKHILDGYDEAKEKGLAIQYVSSFRSNTNLINIGVRATKYIDSSKPSEVSIDNDVFWGFLDHAKGISNDEMQELIAKIIAGEYNAHGTYSMSMLQIIKMLGKSELELFEKMCSLLINGDQIPRGLFSLPENAKGFMAELGIDFGRLQLLQSLGLFFPNEMSRPPLDNPEKKNFGIEYFSKEILFTSVTPDNESTLKINLPGFYGPSPVGKQLVKHLNPKFNGGYFNWLKENYKIPNYKILQNPPLRSPRQD